MDKIIIQDLHVQAVIGVNPNERIIKQNIIMTITSYRDLSKCGSTDNVAYTISYSSLSKSLCSYAESSHHYTLEALATGVAKICCLGFGIEKVKVLIQKPGAIKLAKWPGVEIVRTLDFFKSNSYVEIPSSNKQISAPPSNETGSSKEGLNIVYLAFGSNMGDKYENIVKSFEILKEKVNILETSFMYESGAQYFLEQDSFFNCVCKGSTDLKPQELLVFIKSIEEKMGRDFKMFKNGPRIIDIDIIYYNSQILKIETLEIPHPLMWERDFVLIPLCDIAPNFMHPTLHITSNRMKMNLKPSSIQKIFRIGKINWRWNKKTFIMGILNVTPDSFVDGGKYDSVQKSLDQATKLITQGSDIIDIGGQSTYPGAAQITIQEEIDRVVPVIKKIREKYPDIPISIDTYNHQVAKEAILAGCNLINDVSGAMKDPNMFLIAKEYKTPIILNHQQPTTQYLQQKQNEQNVNANTNQSSQKIDLSNPSVITTLNNFFKERIETATKLGLYRWQLILDPGLGFYKTYEQSIEIIKKGKDLISLGFPVLIGPSRKGFIAQTIAKYDESSNGEVPPPNSERRLYGTVACCCIAASWGVNIVRIHDINQIKDSLLISDSIYKNQQ
ncbi:hypothetical protein DICPUDRAFT_155477 [Dictyostelium purpureum]|uniref:Folic acid synthesis protein FOL1 n=1 Tax=Dictyostelium purpureum TaxID=5786 RepID=F0ZU41_DICPU|nr:uncharacterized protein DICPUDRAFT_155477 [Dictyostelium purpureum]EGC32529.1 hypothetical protein DICPUDRAFT_155477 [Dictyostelium purpureum]|eukprot:XP_003290941.1 hypothetical protein DICPUDRAFT_155477 [Dictyostelium purpureum]